MTNEVLKQCLNLCEENDFPTALNVFNENFNSVFAFDAISAEHKDSFLFIVIKQLRSLHDEDFNSVLLCLSALRIFSRDPLNGDHLFKDETLQLLLDIFKRNDADCSVEVLKCFCNLAHFTDQMPPLLCNKQLLDELVAFYRNDNIHSLRFFSTQLLLFISTKDIDSRKYLRDDINAHVSCLQSMISLLFPNTMTVSPQELQQVNNEIIPDDKGRLIAHLLKLLYNLIFEHSVDDDSVFFISFASLCGYLLRTKFQSEVITDSVHSSVFSTLAVVPCKYVINLLNESSNPDDEFLGYSKSISLIILKNLNRQIAIRDTYLTILFASAASICRGCRPIRKYLRNEIIPPRRDVHTTPQSGNQLRHRIISLFTDCDNQLKEMASEFLFVLCKENVQRLLKYTGYGNAAGMLVTRGLGLSSRADGVYSDDSDSDTEPYITNKDKFNVVTGRVEEPRPNPFDSMTEEQRIHETTQLLNVLDRLDRGSAALQPMTLDEEGKPISMMDHLRKQVHNAPSNHSDSDSN